MKKTLIAVVVVIAIGLAIVSLYLSRRWHVAHLMLNKQTTFITAPLDADGYPDYTAALNADASLGVTPENNAVVLLLQAIEPGEIDEEIKAEYYQALGIPPIEANPRKWESWSKFCTRTKKWDPDHIPEQADREKRDWEDENEDRFDQSQHGPWSREQFPDVAQWLDEQEPALALVVAASRRDKHYSPLIRDSNSASIPMGIPLRKHIDFSAAFRARAMQRVAEEKPDAAWDDLQTSRRFSSLVRQNTSLIYHLIGNALEGITAEAECILFEHADVSKQELQRWKSELSSKGTPANAMVRTLDRYERIAVLDMICSLARAEPDNDAEQISNGLISPMNPIVDWNVPLQILNEWIDRLVLIVAIADPWQRVAEFKKLDQEIDSLRGQADKPRSTWEYVSRRELSESVSRKLVLLFIPALKAGHFAHQRSLTNFDLSQLALGLFEYKTTHGEYPDNLEKLVPDCVPKIPVDHFTGSALVYKRTEKGYKLYSFGPDGKDGGGNNEYEEPPADDVAVHMPFKKPKTFAERKADERAAQAAQQLVDPAAGQSNDSAVEPKVTGD